MFPSIHSLISNNFLSYSNSEIFQESEAVCGASDFNEKSDEPVLAGMKLIPLVDFHFGSNEQTSSTL